MKRPEIGDVVIHFSSGGRPLAAIITAVHDDTAVSLTAFPPNDAQMTVATAVLGTAPGCWSWRVVST